MDSGQDKYGLMSYTRINHTVQQLQRNDCRMTNLSLQIMHTMLKMRSVEQGTLKNLLHSLKIHLF